MQIAMNTWCFPAEMGLPAMLDAMKRAGFQGVELNMTLDSGSYITPNATESELDAVKALCGQKRLPIHALSSNIFFTLPLTGEGERGEMSMDYARRYINIAAALQVDTVLLVPGAVDETVSYQKAYDRAGNAIVELGRYAAPLGVTLALENVWLKFLLSPLEFRHFLEGVRLRNVGAYFDVGNVLQFGYPEHWIEILGTHIKRVHIKDYKAGSGDWYGFTYPLLGSVNWPSVMGGLRAVGYDGWLTTELAATAYDPTLAAELSAAILRSMITL